MLTWGSGQSSKDPLKQTDSPHKQCCDPLKLWIIRGAGGSRWELVVKAHCLAVSEAGFSDAPAHYNFRPQPMGCVQGVTGEELLLCSFYDSR